MLLWRDGVSSVLKDNMVSGWREQEMISLQVCIVSGKGREGKGKSKKSFVTKGGGFLTDGDL